MSTLRSFVVLARPRHWIKSVFVLMPVPFGIAWGAELDPLSFLLGMFGFALVTSSIYAFNDVLDAPQDRKHPVKKDRPIASGRLSRLKGLVLSLLLLVAGAALALLSGSKTAVLVVGLYATLNLIYTLGAKNLPLIDVFLLSSGFVLRVLLGCALLDVPPSTWLLLCSSTLALFMALNKRKAEMRVGGADHRPSLAGYTDAFLGQAIGISAGMTIVAYALYSMEAAVLQPGREFASLPFVAFGVLEYLRISSVREGGGAPVDLVLSSPTLFGTGVGWVAAILWSLGLF